MHGDSPWDNPEILKEMGVCPFCHDLDCGGCQHDLLRHGSSSTVFQRGRKEILSAGKNECDGGKSLIDNKKGIGKGFLYKLLRDLYKYKSK